MLKRANTLLGRFNEKVRCFYYYYYEASKFFRFSSALTRLCCAASSFKLMLKQ